MSNTIQVSNISASTSEKEIRDFLSFCGKISSLTLNDAAADGTKSATVTFEKESASRTALLLDRTTLGSNEIHVNASKEGGQSSAAPTESHEDDGEIKQEDKPRTRIFAEYLAHGYKIGDQVLQKGIEIDNTHGLSTRFTNALKQFDQKTGATARASAVDEKYKITDQATKSAQSAWLGLSSYYDKIAGTPTGQKLHQFYTSSNKQVQDIHNEAMRLAGLKKTGESGQYTPHNVGVDEKGQAKTACGCGGEEGVCGCQPGKCACSDCPRNSGAASSSEKPITSAQQTATGAADKIAGSTGVDPLAGSK